MNTEITIDIFDLKGMIKGLEWLQDNLDKQVDEMLKEIAENGEKYLKTQYSKSYNDPNLGDVSVSYKKQLDGYNLSSKGRGIVYREFGSGDEGEISPHEVKNKFDLDDYNSGGTITDINDITNKDVLNVLQENGIISGNFWFYPKNKKDGVKVAQLTLEQKQNRALYLINHSEDVNISQGVPAGQEMWNTRNHLLNKTIPKAVTKRRKIINDNIIKSITR